MVSVRELTMNLEDKVREAIVAELAMAIAGSLASGP